MSVGDNKPGRTPSGSQPGRNPPLVIVSERGRHSEASRRIVRAQAARASAAQSRETRARNREDRNLKDGASSPPETGSLSTPNVGSTQASTPFTLSGLSTPTDVTSSPLANWITSNVPPSSPEAGAVGSSHHAGPWRPSLGNASTSIPSTGQLLSEAEGELEVFQLRSDVFDRRLPIALPRGFAGLQQRIPISETLLVIVSRTACFDFASPGVEQRIQELLFDIMLDPIASSAAGGFQHTHTIQRYLRIACACLVIFQGLSLDPGLQHDNRYHAGLEAAWAEAVTLNQDSLREPNSVDAALWAVFIICVTTRFGTSFFHGLLLGLMGDLQLRSWDEVRTVLLKFIYPGSFLDELCRPAYESLLIDRSKAG